MSEPFLTMTILAEIHFTHGLIGIDEFQERIAVAEWLHKKNDSMTDPRFPEIETNIESSPEEGTGDSSDESQAKSSDPYLYFTTIGLSKTWVFNASDPDLYPSVPHGHLNLKTRSWPKLNPYIGRAFKAKHQEETKLRLSKKEMRDLWLNNDFRVFCRNHIVWYMATFPSYSLPVARPLRFPKW